MSPFSLCAQGRGPQLGPVPLSKNIYVLVLSQVFDIQIDKVVLFLLQIENSLFLICCSEHKELF